MFFLIEVLPHIQLMNHYEKILQPRNSCTDPQERPNFDFIRTIIGQSDLKESRKFVETAWYYLSVLD